MNGELGGGVVVGVSAGEEGLYRERLLRLAAEWHPLPDKPEETPEASLAALWHAAAGRACSVRQACRRHLPALDTAALTRLDDLIRQRLAGVPLAHLIGWQEFMGIELMVSADALIPRAETELLGRAALSCLEEIASINGTAKVIDVCTGSGNLALTLARYVACANVWAADLSPEAVTLAKRNAELLGLGERVRFCVGDLLAPMDTEEFHGAVDLLVCNPPYISSGKVDTMPTEIVGYEPRLAFDGGPLGIRILQRLIGEAPRYLRVGGWLAFEVGLGQARGVRRRMKSQGAFGEIREIADAEGEIRALLGRMN